jgi:O-6-methylguanine DNA methyltransferase
VGRANAANPVPIIVPCHRVLGADGSLVGYASGIKTKEFLLKLEGALMI